MSKELKQGPATLRWQPDKQYGFAGVVILAGKRSEILHDDDEKQLIARLRNEAGKLHPHYVGFDGAMKRFLEFMPGGLRGGVSDSIERSYKQQAAQALAKALTTDAARNATDDDAKRVAHAGCWINILSKFESMRLKDTLNGPNGGAFLRSAGLFASGNFSDGGRGMDKAVQPHGRLSWPMATYFPFLWDFQQHMFLKPLVTVDFSERVGHQFQYDYKPEINAQTYESLLDLIDVTRSEIGSLEPRDNIDIQSFIYVAGEYGDDDLKT